MIENHWSQMMLPRERIEQLEAINNDLRQQLAEAEARCARLEAREQEECEADSFKAELRAERDFCDEYLSFVAITYNGKTEPYLFIPEDMGDLALDEALRRINAHPARTGVPEGYALIPNPLCLDYNAIEHILTMTAWDEGHEAFGEGVLWVGSLRDDDGNETYGLNISCAECMEEGGITLHEFPQPPATQESLGDE